MLKNHIILSLRNIKKYKGYSFINIAGLAAGMAVTIFIMLYISFETSYDKYHENADRIYRVTRRHDNPSGYKPHFARCHESWVNDLPEEFAEVETLVRFQYQPRIDLRIGDKKFRSTRWFTTDNDVFKVFSFPLIYGSPETALENPHSVVLTENTAQKYFGTLDIIGREILVSRHRPGSFQSFTVTGVMKNLPAASHFQIDFLASYPNKEARLGWAWIYILLERGSDPSLLKEKFPAFIEKNIGSDAAPYNFLHLQALTDIHLKSHLDREIEMNGDHRYVLVFSITAFLVMLIACVNFMNLATARSMRRAREIGVRKVLGASRGRLIKYFLTESMIYSFIALISAVLIAVLLFPVFDSLLDNKLEYGLIFNRRLVLSIFALFFSAGLFAGIYPAFVLSGFQPLNVLKGGSSVSQAGQKFKVNVRKALVVLQFTISIALIICTLISSSQFRFLSNAKLGMNKEQLIAVQNVSSFIRTKYPVLRSELMKSPDIIDVTACMDVPSRDILDAGFCRIEGLTDDSRPITLAVQSVDVNYFDFMEIETAAGRNFPAGTSFENPVNNPENPGLPDLQALVLERDRTYLINESALKVIGWNSPEEAVGKRIDWRNAAFQTKFGEIIGVVKDYHYASLRQKIRPLLLMHEPVFLGVILIKIQAEDAAAALSHMQNTWDRLFPDLPMPYEFVDDLFAKLYRAEQKQGMLLLWFSAAAVFIAYLGLFGLASFAVEQKNKEISIRKIMGAAVSNIASSFLIEFTKWVAAAMVLAVPVSWYAMDQWLQNYAYRIDIEWHPFVLAAGFALVIAVLTTGYQSVKAASANPIDSLRHE